MTNVFKKRILFCWAFVKVKINGILTFAEAVKSLIYEMFRDLNQESVDIVLFTVAHYKCAVEDS